LRQRIAKRRLPRLCKANVWRAEQDCKTVMQNTDGPVVIAIPSYRRPDGLARLLASIEAQVCDIPDKDILVIVAENDLAGQQALALVAARAPQFRFALHGYLSAARGISNARNALLRHGFGTHKARVLAMLDDDQWIEPDWLQHMVTAQTALGADVLRCHEVADFMGAPKSWVHDLAMYRRDIMPTGPIDLVYAANGVMISHRVMQIMPNPQFDDAYSFTGGEDSEFFARLQAAGGSFAFCAQAVVHECYPPERQTLAYIHKRIEWLATVGMARRLRRNPSLWFAGVVVLGQILGAGVGVLGLALTFYSVRLRQPAMRRLMRVRGNLRAVLGRAIDMYR
jgi:succinoglycan biosynthesis protein ExoM